MLSCSTTGITRRKCDVNIIVIVNIVRSGLLISCESVFCRCRVDFRHDDIKRLKL